MDVVYILRNGIAGDELRYSLRSLKNLPHDKVWFFGGVPEGLKPDEMVALEQRGISTWEKVCWTLLQVCQKESVSTDFYLFNDDFFVMKPVKEIPPYYDGTLLRRIEALRKKTGGLGSLYSNELERTRDMLTSHHKKTYNYALHVPMVINRDKGMEVLMSFNRASMFRSLYGNYWNIGGRQMADPKISDSRQPDRNATFLSTSDYSFDRCAVGEYIRKAFPDKCEYEI